MRISDQGARLRHFYEKNLSCKVTTFASMNMQVSSYMGTKNYSQSNLHFITTYFEDLENNTFLRPNWHTSNRHTINKPLYHLWR